MVSVIVSGARRPCFNRGLSAKSLHALLCFFPSQIIKTQFGPGRRFKKQSDNCAG